MLTNRRTASLASPDAPAMTLGAGRSGDSGVGRACGADGEKSSASCRGDGQASGGSSSSNGGSNCGTGRILIARTGLLSGNTPTGRITYRQSMRLPTFAFDRQACRAIYGPVNPVYAQ